MQGTHSANPLRKQKKIVGVITLFFQCSIVAFILTLFPSNLEGNQFGGSEFRLNIVEKKWEISSNVADFNRAFLIFNYLFWV